MPRTKAAFQQIRDESRRHILEEAAQVFAQKGLAGAKISDVLFDYRKARKVQNVPRGRRG